MDNIKGQQDFGVSKRHNRHFLILSVCILAVAVAALYVFSYFGYFGSGQVSSQLTEDKCLDIFYSEVGFNSQFTEISSGNKTVKEARFVDGSSLTKLIIEKDGENIKCYIKRSSDSSIFKSKGLGSTGYSCENSNVS